MRQLLPEPITTLDETEVRGLYAADPRPVHPDRPWVLVNMISSLDGVTAVDGRSGGLGTTADRTVFRALRAAPDAIMVGAGTARIEGYGPVRLDAEAIEMRRRRGQTELPRLVIVSGRLDLDPDQSMFIDSPVPPIVFTGPDAPRERLTALDAVAEVVPIGDSALDLRSALEWLHRQGIDSVLCEGGPTLNGHLTVGDLIDEWCLSVAPVLVGGQPDLIGMTTTAEEPRPFELSRVLEEDGMLFLRLVRARR